MNKNHQQDSYQAKVSIRPNCITLYSQPVNKRERSELQKLNETNLLENDHKGVVSNKADKRIKNAIDWLLYLSETKTFYNKKYKKNFNFRLCFVTLTL